MLPGYLLKNSYQFTLLCTHLLTNNVYYQFKKPKNFAYLSRKNILLCFSLSVFLFISRSLLMLAFPETYSACQLANQSSTFKP